MQALSEIVQTRRLRLAGHVLRLPDARSAHVAMTWIPESGRRTSGRPPLASEAGGMQGIWHPQLFLWGILICISPLENLIPIHANCMQHVLRCWERQSDGSEYKKTLRRPGLHPGPRWGSLQRSRKPPSWWGGAGCVLLKNPNPRSRPFVLRLYRPTPKLVPTTLSTTDDLADVI